MFSIIAGDNLFYRKLSTKQNTMNGENRRLNVPLRRQKNRGLRYARMLGIQNMREQCFLTAAVQNMKRLVKAFFFFWLWLLDMNKPLLPLENRGLFFSCFGGRLCAYDFCL